MYFFSLAVFDANQKFSLDMLNEILTNNKFPKSLTIYLSLRFSLIDNFSKKKLLYPVIYILN